MLAACLLCVESPIFASQTLANDFGVLVYENCGLILCLQIRLTSKSLAILH